MNQEVAFRRINGRIVPIRLNKQKKETIKGAAIAGSGAAIALGGASIYKRAINSSVSLAKKAYDLVTPQSNVFGKGGKKKFASASQMSFDDILARTNNANADKAFKTANKLAKLSTSVRKGSLALGTGLIFYGATKAVSANKKKKISPETSALVAGAGALTVGGALSKSKEIFEFGLQNKQQKMQFAKSAATNFSKAFLKKIF